jgi:hypothetical protein
MGCSNLSFSKKRLDIQYNKCLIRVKPNSWHTIRIRIKNK